MIKSTLLWEISKVGLESSSYIFGTMHVRDAGAFEHVESAINVLYKCQRLRCEIDIDDMTSISPSLYLLPHGNTLENYMSKKQLDKISTILHKAFDFDLYKHSPLLPLLTINKITECVLSKQYIKSLDAHIWEKAKSLKMECSGIESLEEQISILRNIPIDLQVKMLKDLSRDVRKFQESVSQLRKLYINQDIKRLYKLTKKSLGSLRREMLYKRNVIMANRIADEMSNIKTFYAVGAAHLYGEKGILTLLKRQNLKITGL